MKIADEPMTELLKDKYLIPIFLFLYLWIRAS